MKASAREWPKGIGYLNSDHQDASFHDGSLQSRH
jgi:hypothetical protein